MTTQIKTSINIGKATHAGYSKNLGSNPNEDRMNIISSSDNLIHVLAVFDGHGGDRVSEYVNNRLPKKILEDVLSSTLDPYEISKLLASNFMSINEDICKFSGGCGSTGTVCIITPSYIITANIGDSPAILFNKENQLIETTIDHDCNNNEEETRIKIAGNDSIQDINGVKRLKTGLVVTRSFGDKYHSGVIAEPQIYIWKITCDMIIAVLSDSFVELLVEKPRYHIGPYLTRNDIIIELNQSISTTNNLQEACDMAVNNRCEKLKINNKYVGDNTTLLLMEIKI